MFQPFAGYGERGREVFVALTGNRGIEWIVLENFTRFARAFNSENDFR